MSGIEDSPVRQFQNFIFSPMGIIILSGVFLAWFYLRRKKTPDLFKPVELSTILKDRLSGTLKIIEENNTNFGTIRAGDITIGKIKKHGIVKFEIPIKHKKKEDSDLIIETLHLFEVRTTTGLLTFIMDLLRIDLTILIIPDPFIKRYSLEEGEDHIDYFNIIEHLDIVSFGGIYFYGWSALKYIKGHAWLKGREDELEELINYPKKVVYLDTQHTKHMEEVDKIYALDKSRRDSYLGSLMPDQKKKK